VARILDHIVVVDLESTCWEGSAPEGQPSDIIELGVCLLDVKTLARSDKRSILVKPERSSISAFCEKLTTLKPSDFGQAGSLAEACAILRREYRSKERLWASYGDYDRRQLERSCSALEVPYPMGPTHLNVKNLFAITRAFDSEVGMDRALEILGLPLEGTHHRGGDDAWNIAAILAQLIGATRRCVVRVVS